MDDELTPEEKAKMRKRPIFVTKWEVSFFTPKNVFYLKHKYGNSGELIKADETVSLSTFIPCLIETQKFLCDYKWQAEQVVKELKKDKNINKIRMKAIKTRIYDNT